MNLPIRSIEFDAVLKKPEGEMLLEEIPTDSLLNRDKSLIVNIASPEEIKASFSYVQPLCVKPLDDGTWQYCNNKYDEIKRTDQLLLPEECFLEGDRYIELSEGLYFKKNNDEKLRITNARIRVIGIRECWESETECKKNTDLPNSL